MKRPIEVADIRAGDLIRWEGECDSAREWRSASNATPWSTEAGQHYLLDRPEPAVELPTVPTLGWVTVSHDGFQHNPAVAFVGPWQSGSDGMLAGGYETGCRTLSGTFSGSEFITAFTPATAVPTEALDALRADGLTDGCCVGCHLHAAVRTFLAAVDAANRADR